MSKVHRLAEIDESWSLFLDRDGVINRKLKNDYVKYLGEFEFKPGVLEALYKFDSIFYKIFIVTNQQGIAKGIMNEVQLSKIHQYLLYEVENAHGRIDEIYYCPHLAGTCKCRKPEIGMALNALESYPNINLEKSIMVGDSEIDMVFGKRCGMLTVQVIDEETKIKKQFTDADFIVKSLKELSELIYDYVKD